MDSADRAPIMATRLLRNDNPECLDPGFLTVCHHTKVALSDGWSASGPAVRLNYAAAGTLARTRYSPPLASSAHRMRACMDGPLSARAFDALADVSRCGHVYGLCVRSLTAGPDVLRGSSSKHGHALDAQ